VTDCVVLREEVRRHGDGGKHCYEGKNSHVQAIVIEGVELYPPAALLRLFWPKDARLRQRP